ncbi:uncharacterized protein MONOS_7701 [Monocercomonoides exilis]|uniref:uncharacterized protein n=1 Tax=Monocercomonoides exilis TaxID=2049356 RepID=UPI00355A0116|nr:hypothetical protein MONOS_7701 [Monocercomonoides exilis]|eukprot:MONOS_7701.1-p1 / transcript=MONOS_7701.1 / gene=MONOS_7701 / organism=Monocercomonoides_exilis_PA203 / gene_product=unspecified product / transcript_product=unspecified product / location=Mono_scaffold00270:15595-17018(+) / protein_length=362 / sequence_SO=supercontig / SO=protein_coding / is_pseudo=false
MNKEVVKVKGAAQGREKERAWRAALCRETKTERRLVSSGRITIRQEVPYHREIDIKTETAKYREYIRNAATAFDHEIRIRKETTEEGSVHLRETEQMSERIGYREPVWPQDVRYGNERSEWITGGTTVWETSERIEQVEEDKGRQTCEPWYKSTLDEPPVPNLSRGEKMQAGVSGNDKNDEQLFIPLGGGIEGWSGESRAVVGGEVVQPNIHGSKEERKVEKDPGLQSSKRGRTGKALQDGFPGDSRGTPGGERLDDHFGYIEQGCIEIDLTGDSPVPEKSGLDTVGRETEVGTRKERGVSGMVVELRKDGSNTPRREESAAPGGCANLDSICKEKEETKDEGFSSTPRDVEFCEVTTPTS